MAEAVSEKKFIKNCLITMAASSLCLSKNVNGIPSSLTTIGAQKWSEVTQAARRNNV